MPIFKTVGKIVRACDLFFYQNFIRYKNQDMYKTITGGLCSLVVIIIFALLFYSTAEETILKSNVDYSYNNYRSNQPVLLNEPAFQMAFGIDGINLSQTPAFLEIYLALKIMKNGKLVSQTRFELQSCSYQLWSDLNLNVNMSQTFIKLRMDQWLCLPKGLTLTLNGSKSAKMLTYADIIINKCNRLQQQCVNQSQIENYLKTYQQFSLKVFFIDSTVNPSEPIEYINYHFDDTKEYPFNYGIGIYAELFFAEFDIDTEDTILPKPLLFQRPQKGVYVDNDLDTFKNFMVISENLAKISLKKSASSVKYSRKFRRIDDLISYLGGLFGGFLLLLILISKYNERAFALSLAQQMYQHSSTQKSVLQRFNICKFLAAPFYFIWQKLKTCCNRCSSQTKTDDNPEQQKPTQQKQLTLAEQLEIINTSNQIMESQLSINTLFKRIQFLQRFIYRNFQSKKYYEGLDQSEKMDIHVANEILTNKSNEKKKMLYNSAIKNRVGSISKSPPNQELMDQNINTNPFELLQHGTQSIHEMNQPRKKKDQKLQELEMHVVEQEIQGINEDQIQVRIDNNTNISQARHRRSKQ